MTLLEEIVLDQVNNKKHQTGIYLHCLDLKV